MAAEVSYLRTSGSVRRAAAVAAAAPRSGLSVQVMPRGLHLTVKSCLLVDPLDGLAPTSRCATSSNHVSDEHDAGRSSGSF